MFHIVSNHPFVDGNKRAGALAALVFLDMNGIEIHAPKGTVYDLTIAVAKGELDKARITDFFQSHAS